eukprot:jgi/Bigna1/76690/fgenesh1_pg.43_\
MGVAASTSAGWTCTALAQGGKREPGDEIKFSDLFADEMLQEAQPKRSRAGLIALGGIGTVVTGVIVGRPPLNPGGFPRAPPPNAPDHFLLIVNLFRGVLKPPKGGLGIFWGGGISPTRGVSEKSKAHKNRETGAEQKGSGDGRVVIQAAKKGWKASLSEFDYIVLFGAKDATSFMEDLEDKLIEEETKEGAKVIACRFPMSTFTPIYEEVDPAGEKGLESVWVYDLDAEKAKFRELEEDDYTASS